MTIYVPILTAYIFVGRRKKSWIFEGSVNDPYYFCSDPYPHFSRPVTHTHKRSLRTDMEDVFTNFSDPHPILQIIQMNMSND